MTPQPPCPRCGARTHQPTGRGKGYPLGARRPGGAPTRSEERPVLSLVDIQAGKWTREMEANSRYHAQVLGYPVKPFAWPDGEVW